MIQLEAVGQLLIEETQPWNFGRYSQLRVLLFKCTGV